MEGRVGVDVAARVAALFPHGAVISNQWTSAGCRAGTDEVIVLTARDGDARLYGIPVSLEQREHDFYYGKEFPVSSLEEWLESVATGFYVMLETGYFERARRRLVGDYIELRDTGGWPEDDRFYLYRFAADGAGFDRLRSDPDLDVSLPNERLAQGRLIEWVIATENNATAGPRLGQAVISHDAHHGALLELVETTSEVPDSVWLELARESVLAAGPRFGTVATKLENPLLAILGFVTISEGVQQVSTDLLGADPDTARELVQQEILSGALWGRDRDIAGRAIPLSKMGRVAHRIRWPRSGRQVHSVAVFEADDELDARASTTGDG